MLWIASDVREIRARRLIRFRAAMLPVAWRPKRNVVPLSKFLLRQFQRQADDFHLRSPGHALQIGFRRRLRIRIRARARRFFDLFRSSPSNHLAHYNTATPSASAARRSSSSAVARGQRNRKAIFKVGGVIGRQTVLAAERLSLFEHICAR